MPRRVFNRVVDHLRLCAEKIAEWDYYGADWIAGYQPWNEIREKVARLINSEVTEVALTENATAGMNYIANGLDLQPGDEVLGTDQEHPGGECGWKLKAKRSGTVYRQLPLGKPILSSEEVIETFIRAIGPKTRVIAIPHIITGSGAVLPVKEICSEAARRGVLTVIDGAQTPGQIKIDVKELGCDAYYGSLHKWLCAPAGNGFLYLKKKKHLRSGRRWPAPSGIIMKMMAFASASVARVICRFLWDWRRRWIFILSWGRREFTSALSHWAII